MTEPQETRAPGLYPTTRQDATGTPRDYIDAVDRGGLVGSWTATRITLRAIDVGFDLRQQQHEVALPSGMLIVETDDTTYLGDHRSVARQMKKDGWIMKYSQATQ